MSLKTDTSLSSRLTKAKSQLKSKDKNIGRYDKSDEPFYSENWSIYAGNNLHVLHHHKCCDVKGQNNDDVSIKYFGKAVFVVSVLRKK